MSPKWVALLLILGALSACVTLPSGPRLLVLPGERLVVPVGIRSSEGRTP
jgi:hypothetical protein